MSNDVVFTGSVRWHEKMIDYCEECTAEPFPDQNGITCAGHGLHYEDCTQRPRYPEDDQ